MQKLRKIRLLPGFLAARAAQAGQLSMFMGVTLIIIICLIAFIINVGLFVRAKINLQNAVDAAAYSGAASQARLLTQIAYVNWEMRNNYKEWLFKYYVLGQLGNPAVLDEGANGGTGMTRFRAKSFEPNRGGGAVPNLGYHKEAYDPFNIPTICIHPGSSVNICARANVPGIPRFNTVGLPSISEKTEEFLNTVVAEKAKDCSRRTDLNFGTGMIWTFGPGGGQDGVANQGFSIAADRTGVWPKAMELAFRIRNLEMLINRPPIPSICFDGCSASPGTTLQDGSALNERPLKAFYSAWRNLDGGDSPNHQDLKGTFKLHELPPKSSTFGADTLSGYLIPATEYPPPEGGSTALTKHYVDLQMFPMNYAIFFTAFVSTVGELAEVRSEGECIGSKTAIPVPGLPVGFVKNPNIVTYYAVKGEAKFIGLFYPFEKNDGITLTAYAAAKPMGGRIGPRNFKTDVSSVYPRGESPYRTVHEAVGLDPGTLSAGFAKGKPIPATLDFYVTDTGRTIGGTPVAGQSAAFAIPNLVYDYLPGADMPKHESGPLPLILLKPITGDCRPFQAGDGTDFPADDAKGLYQQDQFKAFFSQLDMNPVTGPSATDVAKGILKIRRPTKYEAMNYLIPAYYPTGSSSFEGPSVVVGNVENDLAIPYVNYQLYAPLIGAGTLFPSSIDLLTMIGNHIDNSASAVVTYLKGFENVAKWIRDTPTAGANDYDDGAGLTEAANLIYPDGITPDVSSHRNILTAAAADPADPTCAKIPMASKFAYFFQSQPTGKRCGIVPINETFLTYFNRITLNGGDKYLTSQFVLPDGGTVENTASGTPGIFMTGFMPGARQGAEESTGEIKHPFSGDSEVIAKRNYYSVKFVSISNLLSNQGYFNSNFSAYLENSGSMGGGVNATSIYGSDGPNSKNSLDTTQLSLFPTFEY